MQSTKTATERMETDAFVRAHFRRNIIALGSDYSIYGVAMAFASMSTILPAFAARLGADNLLIGL